MPQKSPVVLELAPLPREQMGPFILLGVDKDADTEQIEAGWARRLIQARKKQINIALEDINWAKEVILDRAKRLRADAGSLNLDTSDGTLRRLAERYGGSRQGGTAWQPRDSEKGLRGYAPPADLPDVNEVRAAVVVPQAPEEVPAATALLRQLALEPAAWDPWAVKLPTDPQQDLAP